MGHAAEFTDELTVYSQLLQTILKRIELLQQGTSGFEPLLRSSGNTGQDFPLSASQKRRDDEINERVSIILSSQNPAPYTALLERHDAETKAIILTALNKCNWNRKAAAKLLTGRSDSSAYKMLLYLIKKLGVDTSNGA